MEKRKQTLVYLQHVPFETPGIILDWAKDKGFVLNGIMMYENPELPMPDEYDWLIVMGGPMNIYDEEQYPWLSEEKAFIRAAIDCNRVVFGFCLGAQLIADALGGNITKNPQKEIGWFSVSLTQYAAEVPFFKQFPKEPVVFQWHGDTFSTLPPDVVLLAESNACKNQAFCYKNRVFGFQFHLENTESSIKNLIENCRNEMNSGTYVQSEEYILSHMEFVLRNNQLMKFFLDAFLNEQERFD